MRVFRTGTLALAALTMWCVPARPAEEKMVPEEGALRVILLRHKSVREELKLTEDETKKVHDFTDRQWKKAQRVEEMAPAERDREFATLTQENERFLKEILEPDQLKRLNQIALQTAGLLSVTHPVVAAELKLTGEQKTRAHGYQMEARRELQDLLHSQTRGDRHAKLKELRATSRKRLLELLTDEQETKWKEMAGAPFHGEIHFETPASGAPARP